MTDLGAEPPNALDAERCVLGAMLLSRRAIDDVAEVLTAAEHYRPAHEVIHAAIVSMHGRGEPVDAVTVAAELLRLGDLARVGGAVYLHELISSVPTAANAGYYAGIVRERAVRRAVVDAGSALVGRASGDPTTDPAGLVEDARASLDALAERVATPGGGDLTDALADALEALEAGDTDAVASPWSDLDRLIGGWRPGVLHVIAGRPGTGKSLVGVQAGIHMALTGVPVLVVSCEMTRREVMNRALSGLGGVDLSPARLARGPLTDVDWQGIARGHDRLADARVVIDDRSTVTVADVRARARDVKRRYGGLGMVVVDYLQLLTPARGRRDATRQEDVAEMSRAFKIMSGDLACPVLLLAQLNRGSEHRTDRRPRVSDLRESGAVEQDSDVVILLHRDEDKAPDVLEMAAGKNRHGPTGGLSLQWQGHYSRVVQQAWTPHDAAGVAS